MELFGERLREKVQRTFPHPARAGRVSSTSEYRVPEIIEVFEATFAKLKKLKPDVFLASHGSAFDLAGKMSRLADKSRNPFIETETYPAYLKSTETAFRSKVAEERAAQ